MNYRHIFTLCTQRLSTIKLFNLVLNLLFNEYLIEKITTTIYRINGIKLRIEIFNKEISRLTAVDNNDTYIE